MMTDIEIAQSTEMLPIRTVAEKAGIDEELLECYGKVKAKIDITPLRAKPRKGKLILVTAINPTPAGEGKTTTSVGLADAMAQAGQERPALPAGALPRPGVRRQGRRSRRRLCAGGAHGGHQPPLHRRFPRHRRGQ